MKLKNLLIALLALTGLSAQARDIHGVHGYYNFTAQRLFTLDQSKLIKWWGDGRRADNFLPKIEYDGNYMKMYPGISDTTRMQFPIWRGSQIGTTSQSGCSWRISIELLNYNYPMTITKEYPVVAFKFSLAKNSIDSTYNDMYVEHRWVNPYTGITETMKGNQYTGLSGVGNNGRMTYVAYYPGIAMQTGVEAGLSKDSICYGGKWDARGHKMNQNGVMWDMRQTNTGTGANRDTSMVFMRLPDTSGDKAEFVMLLNYYSIADSSSLNTNEIKRILDRTNITIPSWNFAFGACADTLNADGSTKDDSQRPVVYFKWLKTYKNLQEAMDAVSADNNWGDGTANAYREQLNDALYYAEQALAGFKYLNSDPDAPDNEAYLAYQKAYNVANETYNNAAASDEEYQAAAVALQQARVAFNEEVDFPTDLLYNYVTSATGSGAITVGNDNVTIGDLTGKALLIGANDAASALSFVPTGVVTDGQKTYYLKSGSAAVVQASDGTLLLVDGAAGSTFTFSKRDAEGPSYDLKCGDYYYYVDENGALNKAAEITAYMAEDFETLSAYLFTLDDALADYAQNASESEKTGLDLNWEFNATPEDDPSTKGTVNGEEKTMREYSETKMIDGWRMSRWRMQSRVNQAKVKNADGTDATCLELTAAPEYDSFDGAESYINDYTTPAAIRYDFGETEPFYARDPQKRDDSHVFYINAGIRRYLAIKMRGTNDVEFAGMNIMSDEAHNWFGPAVHATDIAGKKGDVIYFDLLAHGWSVGKVPFISAWFSPVGFTSADSKLYIDWMRTYATVDEIPEESFDASVASSIGTMKAADRGFMLDGNTVVFFQGGAVYTADGCRVAQCTGRKNISLRRGLYIVKAGNTVSKVIVK